MNKNFIEISNLEPTKQKNRWDIQWQGRPHNTGINRRHHQKNL